MNAARLLIWLGFIASSPGPDMDSVHVRKTSGGFRSLPSPFSHRFGGCQYGLDDVMISGAAADVAFQFGAHRLLVKSLRMTADHVGRRHDHPRRAETALQSVMLAERRLHRMKIIRTRKPFYRKDFRSRS